MIFFKILIVNNKILRFITIIDANTRMYTNDANYLLTYVPIYPLTQLPNYLLSAIGAGAFFLLLYIATKGRGMGFGDVKLALLMGLFLGFPKIVTSLYFAFLTGAVVSVMLILRGKKKLKSHIPFGPFLAGSTIFALFYGHYLWEKIIAAIL